MDRYGKLVRDVLYPTWERRIKRRPVLDMVQRLRTQEQWSLTQLREYQTQELHKLLQHAHRHVPHYRETWQAQGYDPKNFAGATDLQRLPLLTRQLANATVAARVSESGPPIAVRKTTGGTTGEPLVIQYDQASEHWRQAVRLRGFGWAGYQIGAPCLHYWGAASAPNTSWQSRLKVAVDRGLKREKYIDCTAQSEEARNAAVAEIARFQPRFIFCYAQAAASLARHVIHHDQRAWDNIVMVCGAEKVFPDDRTAMETAFGPVFETYGCREFMLIATECERHQGMHTSMENLVVELVNDDGQPVAPGTVGQVAITDLHNFGSPLVRYVNGDLAVATDEPCSCGRGHLRLASVEGRKTDRVFDAKGNAVDGMVFNLLFSPLADEVLQFQAVQRPDRSITLRLVTRNPISPRVRTHIAKQTAKYLPAVPISIERVDAIPLSKSGKRRVVVVEN